MEQITLAVLLIGFIYIFIVVARIVHNVAVLIEKSRLTSLAFGECLNEFKRIDSEITKIKGGK